MQSVHLSVVLGERLCQEILVLDARVIFASIGSFSGTKIASARKPSAALLIGEDQSLNEKYSSSIAATINSFEAGQYILGKLARIVVTFQKNLKIMIIPLFHQEAFVVVVSTRDIETKALAFQITKLVQRFEEESVSPIIENNDSSLISIPEPTFIPHETYDLVRVEN